MKKLSFILCMFLAVNMYAQVADFEEAAITPAQANSEYLLDSTATFTSGECQFDQYVDDAWGPTYYYGFVVSNHTDTIFASYEDAYQVVGGQAHSGNNFAVWYASWYGGDRVTVTEETEFDGFYVNNNTYMQASIVDGFGLMDGAFTATDWVKLTVYGINGTDTVGQVDVDLAKDGSYIQTWTWVDLSELGAVTALAFGMDGSRYNSYGLEIPTYFCMDDLTPHVADHVQYYIKNNWNRASDWTWQEMVPANDDNTTWSYTDIFGGTGVNINTAANDEGALWFPVADMTIAEGEALEAGDSVRFVFNTEDSTLTAIVLTAVVPQEDVTATVFVKNESSWENVYVYAWGAVGNDILGNWPGMQLNVDGHIITGNYNFVFTITGEAGLTEKLIFNNGAGTQYEDLEIMMSEEAEYFVILDDNGAYFEGDEPQGLEDVISNSENNAVKVMHNGQLYIIRDGKTYNANGVLVD